MWNMRKASGINISNKHITHKPMTKTQGINSDGYAFTQPTTLFLTLGTQKFNFKINWNSEAGQRLGESA